MTSGVETATEIRPFRVDMRQVIGPLTDPTAPGGNADAFDLEDVTVPGRERSEHV
jgi:hypothetical protein